MTKLLNKPLKTFIVFTCIVLACSIPAYFYLVESIWIDELDDHNQGIKTQIKVGFSELNTEELAESIKLWNRVHPESKISTVSRFPEDSIYTTERDVMDEGKMEIERFRGLLSGVTLDGKPYRVRIETNVEEVDETVSAIALTTCCFITLLIIGFILLNRQLSKKIWGPFTDTLEKLKRFDLNTTTKIDFQATDIKEFTELNETLERLIANNTLAFTQQKEFAQNASHELQTPLALLKSKLDLLIQSVSLTEEHRSIIESLDNSVSRITRINKNLLLLTSIENKGYESVSIDLSAMVRSLTDIFTGYSQGKGKIISIHSEDGVRVNANESLTEIMISNLLSNAIRHGIEETPVTLIVDKQSISVKNGGSRALNPDALFKRFMSVNTQTQGTGLGLAIVKEICDKYHWKIAYSHAEGHHIFSVTF